MYLKFDFQGSQNSCVRVAISCSDVMMQTQFHHRMLGKLPTYNTTLSEFLWDFVIFFSTVGRTVGDKNEGTKNVKDVGSESGLSLSGVAGRERGS